MTEQPKILLLDDDQDFLDLYREMLSQHLACLPEVRVAASGGRALAMLESEPFNLMVVDLNMPKMDGLQVISVARRKYPEMKLVVLTGLREEQFRTRAYAMGVDQYWLKPETDQEMGLFIESIDSLVSREASGGFRGVQSKSMVDIIQLECLSQTSVTVKVTNGTVEGKIWIQNGEVIDAEAVNLTAEPAFQRILGWKTGSFEILPADTTRTRTIFTSYQGLLLDTAQAMDEAAAEGPEESGEEGAPSLACSMRMAPLMEECSQLPGVEFIFAVSEGQEKPDMVLGLENSQPVADWMRESLNGFRAMGEKLRAGQLQQVMGTGPQRQVAISVCGKTELCVGLEPDLPADRVRETMKVISTKWAF